MRYSIQPRPQLSDKDYEEFEQTLEFLWSHEELLKGDNLTFVNDMVERHEKYGRKVFVSENQMKWLRDIVEKI